VFVIKNVYHMVGKFAKIALARLLTLF
jgi:hypothetical protein